MNTNELSIEEIKIHKYNFRNMLNPKDMIMNIEHFWPNSIVFCKKHYEIDSSDRNYFK